MDENVPRWIYASVNKHFNAYKQTIPLYPIGVDRLIQPEDSFQLRLEGPVYNKITNNYSEIDIHINILITSIKDEQDAYKIQRLTGIISKGFTDEIKTYKYGTPGDDSLLACLILDSEIIVTNFGTTEETTNMLQTTIEASYKWRT